jgi:putative holliday junction resolvase
MRHGEGRLLSLDFGSHRIGVAISDPLGIFAQHLTTIRRQGDEKDIRAIAAATGNYDVEAVIVGLPLLPDGRDGAQAKKARAFAEKLRERLGLPVDMWDERLTTAQAERHLIASGVRRENRREIRDSLSAVMILQSVLDYRRRT